MSKAERRERREKAINHLRGILQPGGTVKTVRNKFGKGTGRYVFLTALDGRVVDISGWVADALQAKWDKEEGGVTLKGNLPGMAVSELGGYLWEDGSKVLHHDG